MNEAFHSLKAEARVMKVKVDLWLITWGSRQQLEFIGNYWLLLVGVFESYQIYLETISKYFTFKNILNILKWKFSINQAQSFLAKLNIIQKFSNSSKIEKKLKKNFDSVREVLNPFLYHSKQHLTSTIHKFSAWRWVRCQVRSSQLPQPLNPYIGT